MVDSITSNKQIAKIEIIANDIDQNRKTWLKLVQSALKFVKCFSNSSALKSGIKLIGITLNVNKVLGATTHVAHAQKAWKSQEGDRYLKTAAEVGELVGVSLTAIDLLDEIGAIKLASIGSGLGKLPVLGGAVTLLSLSHLGLALDVIASSIKLGTSFFKLKVHNNKTATLEKKLNLMKTGSIKKKIASRKQHLKNKEEKLQLWNSVKEDEAQNLCDRQVKKWEIKLSNLEREQSKETRAAIAHGVMLTLFVAAIVFSTTGWASIPAVAFTTSALWLLIGLYGTANRIYFTYYNKPQEIKAA